MPALVIKNNCICWRDPGERLGIGAVCATGWTGCDTADDRQTKAWWLSGRGGIATRRPPGALVRAVEIASIRAPHGRMRRAGDYIPGGALSHESSES